MTGVQLPEGRFYGCVVRSRVVEGFHLTESVYPADLTLPKHSHEQAHFCFVLRGCYSEWLYGHEPCRRGPRALMFHPSGLAHSEVHEEGGRHFLVEVDAARMARVRECSGELARPLDLDRDSELWLATRLYEEFRHNDGASALAVEGLALELLAATCGHSHGGQSRRPRWLDRVRDLLHAEFAERLTLAGIARAAGIHPVHMSRAFRGYFRMTIGEYIRRLRIESACRQLSSSDTPLVKIALDAGFCDQSHFSRAFREQTGVSPSEFRRASRLPSR